MRLKRHQKSPSISPKCLILFCLVFTLLGFLLLAFISGGDPAAPPPPELEKATVRRPPPAATCATVEDMGNDAVDPLGGGDSWKESVRVRRLIRDHFELQGASRVRGLSSDQFCKQGFVMGKASEAGFGNEMYKIITATALSVMLNRSLIIGQTRHFGSFFFSIFILLQTGKYPFGDYITTPISRSPLKEVKHLWRKNDCIGKYGRHLRYEG
ncbi:hypothetical protein OSB04_003865 [Centaurea solstitialis]|uniref:Uncharacterized protein n=1 Tax=Centaurea solstitialis TaxID=347529 RepID=A0AA38TVZ4_9ASTR|nr:hypothetical protein OSB04_003865 [Centaurea solstitialis]